MISHEYQIKQDSRAIAISLSHELWFERISLRTSPAAALPSQEGSTDELQAILDEAAKEPDFSQLVRDELSDFMSRLPADLTKHDGLLRQVREGNVTELISNATAALANRLKEASE